MIYCPAILLNLEHLAATGCVVVEGSGTTGRLLFSSKKLVAMFSFKSPVAAPEPFSVGMEAPLFAAACRLSWACEDGFVVSKPGPDTVKIRIGDNIMLGNLVKAAKVEAGRELEEGGPILHTRTFAKAIQAMDLLGMVECKLQRGVDDQLLMIGEAGGIEAAFMSPRWRAWREDGMLPPFSIADRVFMERTAREPLGPPSRCETLPVPTEFKAGLPQFTDEDRARFAATRAALAMKPAELPVREEDNAPHARARAREICPDAQDFRTEGDYQAALKKWEADRAPAYGLSVWIFGEGTDYPAAPVCVEVLDASGEMIRCRTAHGVILTVPRKAVVPADRDKLPAPTSTVVWESDGAPADNAVIPQPRTPTKVDMRKVFGEGAG